MRGKARILAPNAWQGRAWDLKDYLEGAGYRAELKFRDGERWDIWICDEKRCEYFTDPEAAARSVALRRLNEIMGC